MSTTSLHRGQAAFGAIEVQGGSESVPRTMMLDLDADTGAGGVLAVQNTEGDRLVTGLALNVTTPATGTPSLDAGIAADGSTSSDTLIDGVPVGAAAGVFTAADGAGNNGATARLWPAGQWLTISASADPAGLVGRAHVTYTLAEPRP